MKNLDRTYSLELGVENFAREPVLNLVPDGERTFLWIGNNDIADMRCYATLSGKSLREIAKKILFALDCKEVSK